MHINCRFIFYSLHFDLNSTSFDLVALNVLSTVSPIIFLQPYFFLHGRPAANIPQKRLPERLLKQSSRATRLVVRIGTQKVNEEMRAELIWEM